MISSDTSVLIVDDNHHYASVLRKILSQGFGFANITFLDSVEEAYTRVVGDPDRFTLLFVDFCFPSGQTGGELLQKLHQKGILEGKAAILISSELTPDIVKQAVKAGAAGVVAKPFDRAQLKDQLEKATRFLGREDVESF